MKRICEKNPDYLKCWEFFQCEKDQCPSFQSKNPRCWLISGTQCHDEIQGTWIEKMEVCIDCEVFKRNLANEDWNETLKSISDQFDEYKTKIEEKQGILKESRKKLQEFKTTSIYLLRELDKKSQELLEERNNLERKVEEKTKELLSTQAKLVHSTKMAAIGRFSAGLAHEINNPLGAIIHYARTLLANPEITGQNRGHIELVLKGMFRIENIVKQILSYSKRSDSEYHPTEVNRLIKECIVFLQHKIDQKSIQIELSLADDIPMILIDSTQIQQVFTNIIDNALYALDVNGRIKIVTARQKEAIQIQFLDNGKGISEREIEHLCEPFYTTKEVGEGIGLGLFICYNILQIYQGTLEIKSKEGEGTRVTIRLPIPENHHGKD